MNNSRKIAKLSGKKASKEDAKKEIPASINIQRYAFNITINNAELHGYTHKKIKETFIINFPTVQYFCMADEIGLKEQTPHTHIYVTFTSRVRFATVKKHFPEAHIEIAHATAEANIDYIKKSGRWEGTEKEETKIEGSFEEWGTAPKQKGRDQDRAELYEMVKNGYTNAEILNINNDYIFNLKDMDNIRLTLLNEKYKGTRRLDMEVCYVFGDTGLGKTRDILNFHGDEKVYRVTNYKHMFDSYVGQPVMVFEEFRSQIDISDMLCYCDIYPIDLDARYHNKVACYNKVYIVSNWPLENQYLDAQEKDSSTYAAFLRRISKVKRYNHDGTVTEYASVREYMEEINKNSWDFKKVSDEDYRKMMEGK